MKKLFAFITPILFAAFLGIGCGNSDTQQDDVFTDLYGTWRSDVVAVSDYGHFDGISTHKYGEDGSYRWEVDFTDPNSGCRIILYYTGTFTGDETTLQYTATEGEVEVSSCTDEASNAPNRNYEEEELASASTTIEWGIDGDTLTFLHEDGLDRVYQRQ